MSRGTSSRHAQLPAGSGLDTDTIPGLQGYAPDYPCNNSTTLTGGIQICSHIAVGATVQIDIIGQDIPLGRLTSTNNGAPFMGCPILYGLSLDANGATGQIAVTAKDFTTLADPQGADDSGTQPGTHGTGINAPGGAGIWKWTDVDANPDLPGGAARASPSG